MPPAVRTLTSTRALTGWHRRTRARGRFSTCGSATRSTPGSRSGACAPRWTHRYSVPTVRSSGGCTPPGLARPISPRTARGTVRGPSSARDRSSAGGLAGTRLGSGGRVPRVLVAAGKPRLCLRRARQVWVLSPSSGPASPRAAASTCSVSFSGLLAATSVRLPRTAIHTLSKGSNRIPHRGNLARSLRVSSAA